MHRAQLYLFLGVLDLGNRRAVLVVNGGLGDVFATLAVGLEMGFSARERENEPDDKKAQSRDEMGIWNGSQRSTQIEGAIQLNGQFPPIKNGSLVIPEKTEHTI